MFLGDQIITVILYYIIPHLWWCFKEYYNINRRTKTYWPNHSILLLSTVPLLLYPCYYFLTCFLFYIAQCLLFFDYLCRPVGIRLYSSREGLVFECGIIPGIAKSCDDRAFGGSMMTGWHDIRSVVWCRGAGEWWTH